MGKKLVLIDGHSILNRAFFGLPDLTNSAGEHTNAVYGFLNIMFKILDEEQPDYLTVAFDVHAPTFRHKMYDGYKATRKPMAAELRSQVPLMKEVLHAMGIVTVEREGFEADDVLGTLARTAESAGIEVSLVSGDRDLLQLATDHIKIRIPKTKRTGTEIEDYYAADVKERYGVTPLEFIDVKALWGDTADNIPGVPGIGEKGATSIIAEYHSIEEAHAHVDELNPKRARENLKEYYDQAVLSKELATIKTDCELDYDIEAAALGELYTKEAYEYFKRLEFKNLLTRFESGGMESFSIGDKALRITDENAAKDFADSISDNMNTIAIETLVDDKERLLGYAVSNGEQSAFFDLLSNPILGASLEDEVSEIIGKAGRIVSFDIKELYKRFDGIADGECFDIGVALYVLDPTNADREPADLAGEFLNISAKSRIEHIGKAKLSAAYEKDIDNLTVYVCERALFDAKTAYNIEEKFSDDLKKLYYEMELPLTFVLGRMEKEGIHADEEQLHAYADRLSGRIEVLEKDIYALAGEEFNINSPKQLGVILFEKLELPGGKKTKTGYSTAADVLDGLAGDHEIVAKVLEYRQLTKLKSTYADGLVGCIAQDGRIHTTFEQTVTATGRLSSRDPNLQNIPIRMELGRELRKVFVAKEGCVFVDADYSQIELRVLAHLSGDENLISAYNSSADIHTSTASKVFGVPIEEVTPQLRRNAKAVNFGIVYGISSFGLGQDLGISRAEAKDYIDRYFETYPKMKQYIDTLVADAKECGYAKTMYGRVRPIQELKSSNFMQRAFGERAAMNSPIQGTAADIIKIAMINVDRKLREENLRSKLILQVHDELLIEAYEDELDRVTKLLVDEMEHAAELKVPLVVDVHTGHDWFEAK